MDEPRPQRCSNCGRAFACGADDPAGCWCAALPPLPAQQRVAGAGCLCPDCLRRALGLAPAAPPGRGRER
jgi:hypothetical protein